MTEKTEDKYELRRRRFSFLVVVALIFLVYAGIQEFNRIQSSKQADQSVSQEQNQQQTLPARTDRAIDALGRLAVREAMSGRNYSRSNYGEGWADVMGCDVRNRILQQSLNNVSLDNDGCTVLSGVLKEDPYTGKTIQFVRGQNTSADIQIDHIVAISDSWQKGGQLMSYTERVKFANDSLNLLAVEGDANQEKGGSDASEWLPRKEFRCRYVARQIAVKLKYDLWVTSSEKSAISRVLALCPDQQLPEAK